MRYLRPCIILLLLLCCNACYADGGLEGLEVVFYFFAALGALQIAGLIAAIVYYQRAKKGKYNAKIGGRVSWVLLGINVAVYIYLTAVLPGIPSGMVTTAPLLYIALIMQLSAMLQKDELPKVKHALIYASRSVVWVVFIVNVFVQLIFSMLSSGLFGVSQYIFVAAGLFLFVYFIVRYLKDYNTRYPGQLTLKYSITYAIALMCGSQVLMMFIVPLLSQVVAMLTERGSYTVTSFSPAVFGLWAVYALAGFITGAVAYKRIAATSSLADNDVNAL